MRTRPCTIVRATVIGEVHVHQMTLAEDMHLRRRLRVARRPRAACGSATCRPARGPRAATNASRTWPSPRSSRRVERGPRRAGRRRARPRRRPGRPRFDEPAVRRPRVCQLDADGPPRDQARAPTTSRRWASSTTCSSRSARPTCAPASTSTPRPGSTPALLRDLGTTHARRLLPGDLPPGKHSPPVLTQQGRVQLDADANEQASIELHRLRTLAADLVGPHGGPAGDPDSASITARSARPPSRAARRISTRRTRHRAGRYYVAGILCVNDDVLLLPRRTRPTPRCPAPLPFPGQPAATGLPELKANAAYLAYLDG